MKRSYFTGRRVKEGPTKVGLVIMRFQLRGVGGLAWLYVYSGLVDLVIRVKGGMGNGIPLLRGLFPRLHNLEHLLLTNALHLRQRHTEFRRLLRPFILDLRTQRFGVIRCLIPIQQI